MSTRKFLSANIADYDIDTDSGLAKYIFDNNGSFEGLGPTRDYGTLTQDELSLLLYRAQVEKWIALDLSECGLTEIPPEIGLMTSLRALNLNQGDFIRTEKSNTFTSLPEEIGNLTNLVYLGLYSSTITSLPSTFTNLKSLRFLNINGCKFKQFPNELYEISSLEMLCAGIRTKRYTISGDIRNLSNLRALYLPDFKAKTLPASIGELSLLEELYLGRTKVERLPSSMRRLSKLKKFDIDDTPLSHLISPEILRQSPAEVIDYILRIQSNAEKAIVNESKMIIVGQGGVGKTCLLNQLVNDEYIENASTEGIDITAWSFNRNKENYTLNIWDFGGQEIYHATHQFFLTKRSLYIFVWDARQEDEYGRIDYWLSTIQSFADESPIIIVVNKCDRTRKNIKHIDINYYKKQFPQIIDIFYISCQDSIGIGQLKACIEKTAAKLPLMRTIWFHSWISIRRELEKQGKISPSITYQQYLKICEKHMVQKKEALSLIKYLHDLGVVLHFHDDPLLRNVVILSPEWGTHAVYRVLDAQENILKGRNGILHYKDLEKIWPEEEYPEDIFPYILQLMANFQLSFVIEHNKTYLVAELLDNKEPLFANKKTTGEKLNLRYVYDFLPSGIMTRFIVNAHEYLAEANGVKLCWLKGAYLEYKGALAIVKFDGIADRFIDINVYSDTRKVCAELMNIIRATFDRIHRSIAKISVHEYISCNCSPTCTYLHDYQHLLRLEENHIETERCKESLQEVNVIHLLEGIEPTKKREDYMNINFNPIITTTATSTASSENETNIAITVEIRNSINELQGYTAELQQDVAAIIDEVPEDIVAIQKTVEQLYAAQSKDQLCKSGAMSKLKRLIQSAADPETPSGKALQQIKQGSAILQDMARSYNSIAEWCGLPVVPKLFLGENKK